jgi:hypothetical protein
VLYGIERRRRRRRRKIGLSSAAMQTNKHNQLRRERERVCDNRRERTIAAVETERDFSTTTEKKCGKRSGSGILTRTE